VQGEGKSTVAANLAQLIAHAGKNVILVDGDLRNPSLTRHLAGEAQNGLLEVLGGKVELGDALQIDNDTGLAFLPVLIESRLAHSNEILASDAFRDLLARLRKAYDYVIIDLPPLAPVVDVRATTTIIDSYVFVVEWGRTRIKVVRHQLVAAPEIYERLLGVVLNKANIKVLERYENYRGPDHGRYGYGA
jgi:polysaccharide biosynthesis transport protein